MHFLNDRERRVLSAFCDTIHPRANDADNPRGPALRAALSASDRGLPEMVEKILEAKEAKTRRRLRLMLKLLERRAINGMLAGHWAPFTKLSTEQRTEVLLAMANSPFNRIRGAFHGVKQLVSFLAYANSAKGKDNPFWPRFNYDGRAATVEESDDVLPTVNITHSQTLKCDVLVIGSGAGGAVVAAELAAAGQDVIVVDKGDYFSNSKLPNNELDGMRLLYEERGSLRTADRAIVVLAGSTLGGGTTVNWMTCLEPPMQLREQWAREHGFKAATSEAYADSVRSVMNRINVNQEESAPNFQNLAMERGCEALGYECSVISRNTKNCVKCDFCNFGCRYGAKQDTRRTYLHDAVSHNARIVVRANVNQINHKASRVTGADMTVCDEAGIQHVVKVECDRVVVSAGAIHTPAILMRSGLSNRNIGSNLHLHPVGGIFARYSEPVEAWKGAPQTRICEHFADLDGDGYGVRLENSPAHPGLWGLALPWQGGKRFRELMHQIPHLANTIVLTRDKFSGRVLLDSNGHPILDYKLNPYDAKHLMYGLEQSLRISRAAGAELVYGPHNDCLSFECSRSDSEFEDYIKKVHECGTRPNHLGLFCAHQMASCRIGGSSSLGAISPEGESYDVKNLYVADGSSLPTSTGVNPMVTILSTAHHIA
ncbi:MAG: GMC family oxidoreductase, partial [Planctomycetota bacterium]